MQFLQQCIYIKNGFQSNGNQRYKFSVCQKRQQSDYIHQPMAPLFTISFRSLRYPIALKQTASIHTSTFAKAGQSYVSLSDYQRFNLTLSTGVGLRVFISDFGYGFNAFPGAIKPSEWQTYFITGL